MSEELPRTFCVTMTLAAEGSDEIDVLLEMLELLTQDNQRYIQALQEAGYEVPCCAHCAGVLFRVPTEEDYQNGAILFKCAADMFQQGLAACGTIAAYDAAAIRELEGGVAWVEIVDGGGGSSSYHAVVGTPNGVVDNTQRMEQG